MLAGAQNPLAACSNQCSDTSAGSPMIRPSATVGLGTRAVRRRVVDRGRRAAGRVERVGQARRQLLQVGPGDELLAVRDAVAVVVEADDEVAGPVRGHLGLERPVPVDVDQHGVRPAVLVDVDHDAGHPVPQLDDDRVLDAVLVQVQRRSGPSRSGRGRRRRRRRCCRRRRRRRVRRRRRAGSRSSLASLSPGGRRSAGKDWIGARPDLFPVTSADPATASCWARTAASCSSSSRSGAAAPRRRTGRPPAPPSRSCRGRRCARSAAPGRR